MFWFAFNTFSITVPNKPRNLKVVKEEKTRISLKWDVPSESEGVAILYDVVYISTFWQESETARVNKTNIMLENLRPGTTYQFSVSVFAGDQNSENVTATGNTGKWFCSTMVVCTRMYTITWSLYFNIYKYYGRKEYYTCPFFSRLKTYFQLGYWYGFEITPWCKPHMWRSQNIKTFKYGYI